MSVCVCRKSVGYFPRCPREISVVFERFCDELISGATTGSLVWRSYKYASGRLQSQPSLVHDRFSSCWQMLDPGVAAVFTYMYTVLRFAAPSFYQRRYDEKWRRRSWAQERKKLHRVIQKIKRWTFFLGHSVLARLARPAATLAACVQRMSSMYETSRNSCHGNVPWVIEELISDWSSTDFAQSCKFGEDGLVNLSNRNR